MANIRFKSYDQHQQSFFPLRLDEKIPESHPPRLINRFRSKRMKEQVNSLFIQVVMLLVEMGQISLDVQYIDGTKIESVANRYTFVWRKSTEKNKEKLEEKIRGILSQIDEGIVQDNKPADGDGESVYHKLWFVSQPCRDADAAQFSEPGNGAFRKAARDGLRGCRIWKRGEL
ncbi:transposase [Parabacteroides sp. AF48-14]|uniref:transposase n=1 Tax=Parabacteroides sp. AF48-14 TaxID=2292052 RepID=UPI000EFE0BD5|nr:transposase [Parabacteroides sp. AF48-14]